MICTLVSLGDSLIASGADDFTVKVWGADDGVCLQSLEGGHDDWVTSRGL